MHLYLHIRSASVEYQLLATDKRSESQYVIGWNISNQRIFMLLVIDFQFISNAALLPYYFQMMQSSLPWSYLDPAPNNWNMILSFLRPHSCHNLGWALLQKSFIERLSNVEGQKAKIICRKWIFLHLCILIPPLLALRHWWRRWRIYPRMHLSAIVQRTSHYYCNPTFVTTR